MNLKYLYLIFTSIVCCSCIENDVENKQLKIVLKVLVTKDDSFQLFYNNSYSKSYSEKESETIKISGKNSVQNIIFLLPKGVQPIRIRIDLGQNLLQNNIYLNEISFINKNGIKIFKGKKILDFFAFNENVKYNADSGLIQFNNKNPYYDPYLISKNINIISP